MSYRQEIETTAELADWYNNKYQEMGGCWVTPPEECNRHLDDLGVPFDKSKWLLDIGCGGGYFLEQAEKRVKSFGIEISDVAEAHARKRCNSAVYHGSIEVPFPWDDFDYVISIGSLEHVVNLDQALANIRTLLKPTGKWYFYVPNELWKHEDQPNERTMTDAEWVRTFMAGGLVMEDHKRWNDSTAFWGVKAHETQR